MTTGAPAGSSTVSPKKPDKKNFMFVSQEGKELIKNPGEINGQAFKLTLLEGCTVWIMDHCAQAYAIFRLFRFMQMNALGAIYLLVL
jgi:hypothetical protein